VNALPEVRGHRLWGNLRELSGAPHRFPAEAARAHGGIARFRVLHKTIVAVAHPDYARHVLITHHENYRKSYHYRNSALVLGEGLLASDGGAWQSQRRKVQPAFNQATISRMVEVMARATDDMLVTWEEHRVGGEPVEARRFARALTLRVIGHALLGRELAGDPAAAALSEAILAGMAIVRRRNNSLIALPLVLSSPDNRQLRAARRQMDAFIGAEILRRMATTMDGPAADMLDVLLRSRDPETGETMAPATVLDETKTLFTAGYETTASALVWILYLLASHADIAARWHEEVKTILAGRRPSAADLPRLVYTQQIIQEAMRLYPPVYSIGRESIGPDEIGAYSIPARQTVLISIYGLHRDPAWWTEPDVFRPERFAPGADFPRLAYMPFGAGRRTCIGNHFAMTEMLVALAIIGHRYRLTPEPGPAVEASAQVILVPKTPIWLWLKPCPT
jgi:enediyne biosynthesis protein E7